MTLLSGSEDMAEMVKLRKWEHLENVNLRIFLLGIIFFSPSIFLIKSETFTLPLSQYMMWFFPVLAAIFHAM